MFCDKDSLRMHLNQKSDENNKKKIKSVHEVGSLSILGIDFLVW